MTFVALSAGRTIRGSSPEHCAAAATVNRNRLERTDGQPSNAASTNHVKLPGGKAFVAEVSGVFARSEKSVPFTEAKRRYSLAPVMADQTSVTGAVTFVALSAGEISSGTSVEHPGAAMRNVFRVDGSGGHPLKIASTYQMIVPAGMSRFRCMSLVMPTSPNGSPFTEAQTRYARVPGTEVHVKSIGPCVCDPLAGETRVGALFWPQFAERLIVKLPRGEKNDGQLSKSASICQTALPLGAGRVTLVVVTRPDSCGAPPSMENQMRYAVAPLIPVHAKLTGEGTVVPFVGDVSVIDPIGQFVAAVENLNSAEC